MANICDMTLYVVAATGDDMKSLLETMAANFEKVTNVDLLAKVDKLADWRTYASAMERGSETYNKLCFLSDDPDTRSESGGFFASIASGRPCVCVSMGLKWGPSYQVESFCNGLDSSKYGCACINGGEYIYAMGDDDVVAFIQCGNPFGGPFSGSHDYDEFITAKKDALSKTPTTLHEMALRELFSKESAYTYFYEDSDDYDEDGNDYGGYDSWGLPPINWCNPTPDDVTRIKNTVLEVLAALPFAVEIYQGFTPEGNEAAESLLPGDEVVMTSEWSRDGTCALVVKDPNGTKLGGLGGWLRILDDYDSNSAALGVLSLLLPHVYASIFELVPVSLRNKGVDGPSLRVRLDALPADIDRVMEEIIELLGKDCSERALSSYVREAM